MTLAFKTIALIGKYKSPEIAEPLLELARFLQACGVRVLLDPLTAAHVVRNNLEVLPLDQAAPLSDLAIVIGGDGTMLNIARTLAPFEVALVGVNQGRLGFLTDISIHTMLQTIGDMLDGKFVTESRMLLACQVMRGGEEVTTLEPSKREFTVERSSTTEAGIHAGWRGDLYAVLGDQLKDSAYSVRLYFNPLVRFIWLGAVVMFIGGALSLSDRRLRIGAPKRAKALGQNLAAAK